MWFCFRFENLFQKHFLKDTDLKLFKPSLMLPSQQHLHLLTFCIAVRIDRMVGKADLVAFPRGINNKVWKEKETLLTLVLKRHCHTYFYFLQLHIITFFKLYQALFFWLKADNLLSKIKAPFELCSVEIVNLCVLPLLRLKRKLHMYLS